VTPNRLLSPEETKDILQLVYARETGETVYLTPIQIEEILAALEHPAPMREPRLLRNRARCSRCGDIVESRHRHHYVACGCGALAVDGGLSYLRRTGEPADCEEMSEWETPDSPCTAQPSTQPVPEEPE
jgi:hypothetical protein